MEIKGFLRRPQTLQPKFSLDVDVKEYIKQCRKYQYYNYIANNHTGTNILDSINYYKAENTFYNMYLAYKHDNNVVDPVKFKVIDTYNKLKNSDMYDESICKMGLVEIQGQYYLGIYFSKLLLSVVNSDREAIELRDIYFYLNGANLHVFRTTVDVSNTDFIHPHVSGNFGSYCLGTSPFRMSLDTLTYSPDNFSDVDADIFWVNLYRTITQKTELGDHYYALDKLGRGIALEWSDFLSNVYSHEEFMTDFHKYITVSLQQEEILVSLDYDTIMKDYFHLFSYESNNVPEYTTKLERVVRFNDVLIDKKKHTPIYKKPRTMYNNINSLLSMLIRECAPTSLINKVFDDYKEKSKQSNNIGEQSTGQNQVFEFQML